MIKYSSTHQILKCQFSEPFLATPREMKPPHLSALLCFSTYILIITVDVQMQVYKFIHTLTCCHLDYQKWKLSSDQNF